MVRVQQLASKLGLHGIIVMSPECPDCHGCHQWHVVTDMDAGEAPQILAWAAGKTAHEPDEFLEPPYGVN
jgi:hypothetical protein